MRWKSEYCRRPISKSFLKRGGIAVYCDCSRHWYVSFYWTSSRSFFNLLHIYRKVVVMSSSNLIKALRERLYSDAEDWDGTELHLIHEAMLKVVEAAEYHSARKDNAVLLNNALAALREIVGK